MEEDNKKCCDETAKINRSFNDCSIEEKITRLHAEVKSMRHTIQYFWKENEDLRMQISLLQNHYHDEGGSVTVRIQDKLNVHSLRGQGIASTSFDILA